MRLIAKNRPTHVIANFGSINLMMTIGCSLGVPHRIAWYHTLSTAIDIDHKQSALRTRLQRFRRRFVFQAATHVVSNSAAAKRDAMKVYGIPSWKISVFPNCIADPSSTLSEKATALDHDRIVCVGRLHPVKGQDVLLHALSRLRDKHPNVNVVFVGGGGLKEEYHSLAARLGVLDRCQFIGTQPGPEVLRELATAMISVVPSRSEAFGVVNIESMAVGTPVVASRVGGISEIIRDGVDGFLVPPDDVDALADRLSRVLSDAPLRSELGRNARRRFLERYEREAALACQTDWIESMVSTSPQLLRRQSDSVRVSMPDSIRVQ
jgi:glycosyltransferase involved in cell wall biosynthesis